MEKSRVFLRIIVGGYLAYLGGGLVKDALAEKPENYLLFIGAGILFLAIGLWWLVKAARIAMKHEYIEPDDGVDGEDEEDRGNGDDGDESDKEE